MTPTRPQASLFPALLKFWRTHRGYPQRDLAVAARVSVRHLSFMETGRARPSEDMLQRLLDTLELPLDDRHEMLRAAGFAPSPGEPAGDELAPGVQWALDRMLQQQEPYPLTVLAPNYDILNSNVAAQRVFSQFMGEPEASSEPLNMYDLLFDPQRIRPHVLDWPQVARRMLSRLQREALQHRADDRLAKLLERALRYPGVPTSWRKPDFSVGLLSAFAIRLQRGQLRLAFLTTLTRFAAPLNASLQDVLIESYFPVDAETQATCERLAADAGPPLPMASEKGEKGAGYRFAQPSQPMERVRFEGTST